MMVILALYNLGINPFQIKTVIFVNAVGQDLGCVFGGRLLFYIIESEIVCWEKIKAFKFQPKKNKKLYLTCSIF
jgi:hypothetical protein